MAIGFAFRDILQNFLAGILLLLSRPFRAGDQIVSSRGRSRRSRTRATFLRTYDGRRVVIPNASLFTNPVTVNTALAARRLEFDVGVGYGDDVARAKEVMPGALREVPEAPGRSGARGAGGAARRELGGHPRWWVRPPRQFDALHSQDAVLQRVLSDLRAAGIDLPPHAPGAPARPDREQRR